MGTLISNEKETFMFEKARPLLAAVRLPALILGVLSLSGLSMVVAVSASEKASQTSHCSDMRSILESTSGRIYADYWTLPSLEQLAQHAGVIIQGTVLDQDTRMDKSIPTRSGSIGMGGQAVLVQKVVKGAVEEGSILELSALETIANPRLPVGCPAVLFLRVVPSLPNTYGTVAGPQGKFVIDQGRVVPWTPERLASVEPYRNMSEKDFLTEVGRVVAAQ